MYFPTRSASGFVLARTRLWTLKPVCRQERMRSAHSGLSNSLRTSIASTSRAKISASRESSIRGISWKTPATYIFVFVIRLGPVVVRARQGSGLRLVIRLVSPAGILSSQAPRTNPMRSPLQFAPRAARSALGQLSCPNASASLKDGGLDAVKKLLRKTDHYGLPSPTTNEDEPSACWVVL